MTQKKKILMVDDDKDFVLAQSTLLSHLGYEVLTAYSGTEGFEQLNEHKPDLLILDVNMEREFSGFELHKKIRESKELGDIPIIMLTGIETYHISHMIIDMYRNMRGNQDFEMNKVLRITDNNKEVAVEYYDEDGNAVYLPLDAFLDKTKVQGNLVKEIEKFV